MEYQNFSPLFQRIFLQTFWFLGRDRKFDRAKLCYGDKQGHFHVQTLDSMILKYKIKL